MWRLLVFFLLIFIASTQAFTVYYGPPKYATLGERPFHVAIVKNDVYKCSAALISQKCVLTACSCIVDDEADLDYVTKLYDNYTLVAYTTYLRVQQINWEYATDAFFADGCNPSNNENDAAILCSRDNLLGSPVTAVKEKTKENVRAIVSGWGLSVEGQDIIQNVLQRAYMRVIGLEECRRRYYGVREVPDSALCAVATDEVRGFCSGDIGGPLTHGEGVIGIAVTDFGCGQMKYPGIFTNVSYLSRFFEKSINSFDTNVQIHF